jgi:hypothetical protein
MRMPVYLMILVALAAMLSGGCPLRNSGSKAPMTPMQGSGSGFRDVTAETGLDQARYRWKAGEYPSFAAAWGDYDRDGNLDLLLAQTSNLTLMRQEDGKLKPVSETGLSFEGSVQGAVWEDYDRDGNLDLTLWGISRTEREGKVGFSTRVELFKNTGGGRFQKALISPSPPDFRSPTQSTEAPTIHCVWTDIQNDNLPDLIVCGTSRDLQIWMNRGGGQFQISSRIVKRRAIRGRFALPFDYNQDGMTDIFIASLHEQQHTLLENRGGSFRVVDRASGLDGLPPTRYIVTADLNRDGRPDLIAATEQGTQIGLQKEDRTYALSMLPTLSSPMRVWAAASADFDRDGIADLLTLAPRPVGMGETEVRYYRGRGDATFADETKERGLEMRMAPGSVPFIVADYDGDGWTDILFPAAKPLLLRYTAKAAP